MSNIIKSIHAVVRELIRFFVPIIDRQVLVQHVLLTVLFIPMTISNYTLEYNYVQCKKMRDNEAPELFVSKAANA